MEVIQNERHWRREVEKGFHQRLNRQGEVVGFWLKVYRFLEGRLTGESSHFFEVAFR